MRLASSERVQVGADGRPDVNNKKPTRLGWWLRNERFGCAASGAKSGTEVGQRDPPIHQLAQSLGLVRL